jgi:hypothetical protein
MKEKGQTRELQKVCNKSNDFFRLQNLTCLLDSTSERAYARVTFVAIARKRVSSSRPPSSVGVAAAAARAAAVHIVVVSVAPATFLRATSASGESRRRPPAAARRRRRISSFHANFS